MFLHLFVYVHDPPSSQFETLRGYLRNIYNNAGLEDMTLKTFYGTFKDTPEQPEVMTTVIKWSDFGTPAFSCFQLPLS